MLNLVFCSIKIAHPGLEMEGVHKVVKCVIIGDDDVDKKELLFSYKSRTSPTASQSSQGLEGEVNTDKIAQPTANGTPEKPRFLVLHHDHEDEAKLDKELDLENEAPDVWTDNVVVRNSFSIMLLVVVIIYCERFQIICFFKNTYFVKSLKTLGKSEYLHLQVLSSVCFL